MAPEKKVDRRIQRTKLAIREALITLINEKGFDATLVSDIAELADINRGTFYVHYQDKYDLLEKTQTEIIENIQNIVLKVNDLNPFNVYNLEEPLPFIVSIFEYIKENADLMHALLNLEGGTPFQVRIRKIIEENLRLEFLSILKEKDFLVPSHYLISYVVSAHFGVIQDWLDRGCIESPAEMAIIITKISWFGALRSTGYIQS